MDTPRGCTMPASDQVRECLHHAEDCVQQAASQTDPKLRQDFLILGACWLKLGYELSERLANFLKSKALSRHDRVTGANTAPAQAAGPAAGQSRPR